MNTYYITDEQGNCLELIHARNERLALLIYQRAKQVGRVVWVNHTTYMRKWYGTGEPIGWRDDDGDFKKSRQYALLLDDGKILRA